MTEWTPSEEEQWFMNQMGQLSPLFSEAVARLLQAAYLRGKISALEESKVELVELQSKMSELFAKPLPQPPRAPSFWEFIWRPDIWPGVK